MCCKTKSIVYKMGTVSPSCLPLLYSDLGHRMSCLALLQWSINSGRGLIDIIISLVTEQHMLLPVQPFFSISFFCFLDFISIAPLLLLLHRPWPGYRARQRQGRSLILAQPPAETAQRESGEHQQATQRRVRRGPDTATGSPTSEAPRRLVCLLCTAVDEHYF